MYVARPALALILSVALATPLAAKEEGSFIVRLGRDTTAVEHYVRGATRIEVDQVGRAPRVLRRRIDYDFNANGATSHVTVTVTVPGAAAGAPPFQQVEAAITADSLMMETRRDTSVQRQRIAVPPGSVIFASASPWAIYEGQTMRLAKQKRDSLRADAYFLGASSLNWVSVRRLGRDSMAIQTGNDLFHARTDREGRILSLVPIVGTGKYSLERVANLDVAAMAAAFAERERQSGAMGTLSPRDTVRANADGATLWIDYGRPSKRGRVVFGGIVPWSELWRTGANAATQFRTDKALEIGGQTVPAGFYTLWTIPAPSGWKLVINGETGQWGTEHKAAKDLYTLDMAVSQLPSPVERFTIGIEPNAQGGVLNLDWDTTRASVPFVVKP